MFYIIQQSSTLTTVEAATQPSLEVPYGEKRKVLRFTAANKTDADKMAQELAAREFLKIV